MSQNISSESPDKRCTSSAQIRGLCLLGVFAAARGFREPGRRPGNQPLRNQVHVKACSCQADAIEGEPDTCVPGRRAKRGEPGSLDGLRSTKSKPRGPRVSAVAHAPASPGETIELSCALIRYEHALGKFRTQSCTCRLGDVHFEKNDMKLDAILVLLVAIGLTDSYPDMADAISV